MRYPLAYETADESNTCPECGCSLDGLDREGHALTHWPAELPREAATLNARKRQAALLGKRAPEE